MPTNPCTWRRLWRSPRRSGQRPIISWGSRTTPARRGRWSARLRMCMQVWRALQHLEELGYVTKTKRGRHNVYQLREKISITDGEGRAIARASWDYIPSLVQAAVADVRQVLLSGDLAGAKVVHIEHL